jgi:hypothetical protein
MPKEMKNQPWLSSTGPRTDEGKERSSKNATKHGCTSRELVLAHEDPEEWEAVLEGWLESYETDTPAERRLVEEAAQADWFFQRNTRQYMAAERTLYMQQPNAVLWTDQQHKILLRFERYKAAAQRAFSQAVRLLEQVRKNRLMEQDREHRARCQEMERALRAKRDERKAELEQAKAGSICTTTEADRSKRKALPAVAADSDSRGRIQGTVGTSVSAC